LGNMSVSYATGTTGGGVHGFSNTDDYLAKKFAIQQQRQHPEIVSYTEGVYPEPLTRKEEDAMSSGPKLIRYHVVDPDPVLAEKMPDTGVLMSGTTMLNGMDEKGFVMDLAPRVAIKLPAHNEIRQSVEYDDDEGNTKRLKPIRLGQLDVVLEILKAY